MKVKQMLVENILNAVYQCNELNFKDKLIIIFEIYELYKKGKLDKIYEILDNKKICYKSNLNNSKAQIKIVNNNEFKFIYKLNQIAWLS